MNLTKLALKRPVSVMIIVLALVLFGFLSLFTAPIEVTPSLRMPVLLIVTVYPDAAPAEVERIVSKPIEKSFSTIGGIKNVSSISEPDRSTVTVEFNYGENIDAAKLNIQDKINTIKVTLPPEVLAPVILEMDVAGLPAIEFAVEKVGDIDIASVVEDEISPEFERIAGVAKVEVAGGDKNYIRIEINENRMKQYGLNISMLAEIIGEADFSVPAGSVERGSLDMALRGSVSYKSTQSLENMPLTIPSGKVIHLSDVAKVYHTAPKMSEISRYNGSDSINLQIQKRQGASTVAITKKAIEAMNQINAQSKGVLMSVIYDSSEDIIDSVKSVLSTLLLGALLSMLVLFVFLGDWKASLIVGSSMPVSVLTTMVLMRACGFSFNVISLMGLVIGVGMIVDNSIVVLESCFSRMDQQRTYAQSALEGIKLVAGSVAAGTLTTVIVFFPVGIMQGMSGQMFRQMCFTVIFSLSASLISAITLVPLLFMKLKPREKKDLLTNRLLHRFEQGYATFLQKSFRKKWLVVTVSLLLLVSSVGIVALGVIPSELVPYVDGGIIQMSVYARPGLKLSETDVLLRDLEQMVSESPDMARYSVAANSSSAAVTIYLKKNRAKSTKEWVKIWREQTKDRLNCDISVTAESYTDIMASSSMVDIPLIGSNYEQVKASAKEVEALMRARSDLVRVFSSDSSGNPQANMVFDPIKVSGAGLTPKQIADAVHETLNGVKAGTLQMDDHKYDLRISFPNEHYKTVDDLAGLEIVAPNGRLVPIFDVAEIQYTNAPQKIERKNGQYIVTVSGQPTVEAERTALTDVTQQVSQLTLPEGVTLGLGHEAQSIMEEFTSLLIAISVAVFLVFMVMAMQFESIRFSITVMLCIPFSLIGAFGGLWLAQDTFSLPSMIGFLALVGTVINSGILFIDTADQYRRAGMEAEEALIATGRSRLRPILMTTLTTVLAMIPMLFGTGMSAELMRGIAIVIIGGLTASTILTLLLLPTFYLLLGSKRNTVDDPDLAFLNAD